MGAVEHRRRAAPDRLPRNDEAAEIFQKSAELRIAGGVGDRAMESEILIDGHFAALDRRVDRVEAIGTFLSAAGVARSAASPAASISMPVRNSMTLSTSRSEELSSKSIRNGRRTFSATKAPTPWRVMTSPSARRCATASRTTVRLTPVAAIISCSVGSRDPGASLPPVISAASRVNSCCVKLRGADSGWKPLGRSSAREIGLDIRGSGQVII